MPLWLVDFLTKVVWVVVRNLYPIILKAILKPMSPEDQKKWNDIQRQGGSKEDILEFHKNRGKSNSHVVTGKIVIKENKPKTKSMFHRKDS